MAWGNGVAILANMLSELVFFELVFVLFSGLCFGSFVTLATWRLPRHQNIITGRSKCLTCKTELGFKDLWPVLSWITSGGKCRHCETPISARYPIIELITAGTVFLVYLQLGWTLSAAVVALLAVSLLILIIVDFEHYIIPDQIHLFLLPLGVTYHFVQETSWVEVAAGAFTGAVIGAGLHYGYRWRFKKEGLGFGDVKFLVVVGLWLGFTPMPPFLFFSGIIGILTGLAWRALGRGPRFPFGPALAISLLICILFPDALLFFWRMFSVFGF